MAQTYNLCDIFCYEILWLDSAMEYSSDPSRSFNALQIDVCFTGNRLMSGFPVVVSYVLVFMPNSYGLDSVDRSYRLVMTNVPVENFFKGNELSSLDIQSFLKYYPDSKNIPQKHFSLPLSLDDSMFVNQSYYYPPSRSGSFFVLGIQKPKDLRLNYDMHLNHAKNGITLGDYVVDICCLHCSNYYVSSTSLTPVSRSDIGVTDYPLLPYYFSNLRKTYEHSFFHIPVSITPFFFENDFYHGYSMQFGTRPPIHIKSNDVNFSMPWSFNYSDSLTLLTGFDLHLPFYDSDLINVSSFSSVSSYFLSIIHTIIGNSSLYFLDDSYYPFLDGLQTFTQGDNSIFSPVPNPYEKVV